ncbi:glycosyltransferase family 4 protein [Marinobacter sp. CHS3-4]|uniref:glycosyltransferase family 4 protein n=1 Tax=Marinobacter sp. CHS3-4 TaxID=3045174 RepID=UPI0024B60DCD|nr:glycosyltransferase family 4 protein [Marinobacter sp. CHS3-4]MDI9244998.1 glycosyltransferase family 4 protein [Marinobacter sp. CHS3-4]
MNKKPLNSRPKLLFVGAFPPPHRHVFGGNVTACRALLTSTLPRRVDLELIDSTQLSNPPPALPVRLLLAARRFLIFLVRFERTKPDVVLLFTSVGASVIEKGSMAWYAKLRRVPSLLFPRGGRLIDSFQRSLMSRLATRFAFSGSAKILCQGETWRDFVTGTLGRSPSDAPIVRNWTATRELLEVGERSVVPKAGAVARILFVGWLDREKGVLDLLDACEKLASGRKFELNLVGEGNVSTLARKRVQELGLTNVIHFSGWLDGDDLVQAFREADIFVLPSWSEGLPNAMIEAMAARLAVVVTSVGNITDVIKDGVNGLLVTPHDVTELKTALGRVIDNREFRMSLALRAQVLAASNYGVEPAVEHISEIISEVTGRKDTEATD